MQRARLGGKHLASPDSRTLVLLAGKNLLTLCAPRQDFGAKPN